MDQANMMNVTFSEKENHLQKKYSSNHFPCKYKNRGNNTRGSINIFNLGKDRQSLKRDAISMKLIHILAQKAFLTSFFFFLFGSIALFIFFIFFNWALGNGMGNTCVKLCPTRVHSNFPGIAFGAFSFSWSRCSCWQQPLQVHC